MPRGLTPCPFCKASIITWYIADHKEHCLTRRLRAGEISLETFNKKKGIKIDNPASEIQIKPADPRQRTLTIYQ